MYLYINGEIKREEDIRISPFDHGYLYGLGLFETFRTYQGEPFLLREHMERLTMGAEELQIVLPPRLEEDIHAALVPLLRSNDLEDGYFRLNISAGAREIGLSTDPYLEPTILLYVKPLPKTKPSNKQLQTLQLRRSTPEGASRRKSHHYLNNILGKRETEAYNEGIFLSKNDVVCEGVVSNIFWVKNKCLYTPSLRTGCLNGITRKTVMLLAEQSGFSVYSGEFSLAEAQKADEVFITNAIQEIVPVSAWDSIVFNHPGPVTQTLHEHYTQMDKSILTLQKFTD
ncbi:aminodeoxychorismate lyase [Paenalkalicoccus suaedae]|uniref:Aminodeoxychorismate lyase n=1 Tax=Paenalkalicoccus suaedae TaxID=2592382 RepID=A0A859FAW6_9BACI|nr:aminodeoxychorismate lyase [Paenalkalicoccus suaedae]QKS69664.1 aminodeoxychorismate lyase [Paenalkalicoccus suaedae]